MILQFVLLGLLHLACAQNTTYIGDGYCDDGNEACQEERNFWGSITSEQVTNDP